LLQAHLCEPFMSGHCQRAACPNAHGFAEIHAALNDSSPICWRWLEGRCRVPHCKYAHTFRRCHAAASRPSGEGRRSSFAARPRAAIDDPSTAVRRASFGHGRASIDLGALDRHSGSGAAAPAQQHGRPVALESALTARSKMPAQGAAPVPWGRASCDSKRSLDVQRPLRSFEVPQPDANGNGAAASVARNECPFGDRMGLHLNGQQHGGAHQRGATNGHGAPHGSAPDGARRRSSIGERRGAAPNGSWRRTEAPKPAAANGGAASDA
jgi:hypothetical protein